MDSAFSINSIDTYFGLDNSKIAQKRKIDKLLAPKFKVILEYPYSEFRLSEIVCPVGMHKIEHYRAYPKIFKELKWYEDLPEENMPKHVKSINGGFVAMLKSFSGITAILEDNAGSMAEFKFNRLLPATEYEYEQYCQRHQG